MVSADTAPRNVIGKDLQSVLLAYNEKRVAICLRVSTGEQTTINDVNLRRAARHGLRVVEFFEDAGISGAKGRDKRPGLDRLLKAVARRDFARCLRSPETSGRSREGQRK
jgi:hypothetical protein